MNIARIAVMASGHGTNLRAILEDAEWGECPVDVTLVISDKPDAGALEIARSSGVPDVMYINPEDYADREAFDAACGDAIEQADCQWIALAGFMRILSDAFVQRFAGRIVNIHPSLLPAFPGAHAVADALAHGVRMTGCTVHLVNELLDGGPILAQSAVPVLDGDTVELLHERIHVEEHQLYPAALARMVEEGFSVEGRVVVWNNP